MNLTERMFGWWSLIAFNFDEIPFLENLISGSSFLLMMMRAWKSRNNLFSSKTSSGNKFPSSQTSLKHESNNNNHQKNSIIIFLFFLFGNTACIQKLNISIFLSSPNINYTKKNSRSQVVERESFREGNREERRRRGKPFIFLCAENGNYLLRSILCFKFSSFFISFRFLQKLKKLIWKFILNAKSRGKFSDFSLVAEQRRDCSVVIIQDMLLLRSQENIEYSRSLSLLLCKAPCPSWERRKAKDCVCWNFSS